MKDLTGFRSHGTRSRGTRRAVRSGHDPPRDTINGLSSLPAIREQPACPSAPGWRRSRARAVERRLGTGRHLPLRPLRAARAGVLDRHAAADGERLAARRARLLLHAHRHGRPLPADARAARCSTRWAGTTTACRPSAACRTTTACAATRRSPTTRTSLRPPSRRTRSRSPISRPNFVELCLRLTESDEQAFEELWRTLGLSRRLVDDLHDDRTRSRSASRSARFSACWRAASPTSSRRRRCGTSTSRRRSRRPSSRIASARARCTGCASTRPTATPGTR